MDNYGVKSGASAIPRVTGGVAAALSRAEVARGDLLLAAISGGPDSVALLHALVAMRGRLGYLLAGAHLNHGLRGAESDRDENFVRELCRRLAIDLVAERANGLRFGSVNLEERARDMRMRFFERTADRLGARFVVLGHHADDQAETALMRLLRGSGAAGLAAMDEVGPGRLLRPMLRLRRREILGYLSAIGAEYVIDGSNASPAMLRNRIRHELMPLIEREYASGFSRRLTELAIEMRSLDCFITGRARDELSARLAPGNRLDLGRMSRMEPVLRRAVLREFIRSAMGDLRGVARVHINTAVRVCSDEASGGRAILPGGWQLRREYGEAVLERIERKSCAEFAIEIAFDGDTIVEPAGFAFEARMLALGDRRYMAQRWRAVTPMEAFFDADELGDRMMVRNYRRGDRIRPLGIAGTRKLHDVFVDRKAPRHERERWPLAVVRDEIVWAPGLVRSRIAMVTERSKRVVCLRARPLADGENPSLLVN